MADLDVTSISIRCRFGDVVVSIGSELELSTSILNAEEPFTLRTTVELLGSSAVALLMLEPVIGVEFYTQPCGSGEKISLGGTQIVTTSNQRTYALSLSSCSPVEVGLNAGGVYRMGALLRVGAEEGPALICSAREDLLVQIHAQQSKPAVNRAKKAKKS